ncbi:MAG: tetratricopeptide repeat protein [Acidobacteriota bacterium]
MTATALLLLWMQAAPAPGSCAGEGAVDCWLDRGVKNVAAAETEADAGRKRNFLEEAASDFGQALELDPDRGAALNNLARVDADLGRDEEAERHFRRAVGLDVPLRPFYRRNYGDFLAARGRWEPAVEQYRAVLEEQADLQAHESLVGLLSQHRPDAIPDYLRSLLDHDRYVWAWEVALARLREEPDETYLALLAEARAGQAIPPGELLPSEGVEVLAGLTGDARIGPGAEELLALNEGDSSDPARFSWWAERPGPRRAFRSLVRSFGDSQRQAGRLAAAGDLYRLAVLLTPEEPDLVSFRRMLDLPAATEDLPSIDQLALWNEDGLRKSRPDRTEVYRYRHDLGLHYASLGRWQDCPCPTSGIFQLERAVSEDDVTGPPDGDPPFDALIYTKLVELYLAANRPKDAAEVLHHMVFVFHDHGMGTEVDILNYTIPTETGADPDPDVTGSVPDELGDPPVLLRDFTTRPPR